MLSMHDWTKWSKEPRDFTPLFFCGGQILVENCRSNTMERFCQHFDERKSHEQGG